MGSFLREGQWLPKPIRRSIRLVSLVLSLLLLNACASPYLHNIKPGQELGKDEKILAGRFVCFENDAPVHCTRSGFFIFFNREGEVQSKLFNPDDAGYVYVPVVEGYYNIATFAKQTQGGKGVIFDLELFPVVLVRTEDKVVNFGTFEVRFYQSPQAMGRGESPGGDRPQLRVNHITNYEVTRSEIASRLGKSYGTLSDGSVQFLPRARR